MSRYSCSSCGYGSASWYGKCPSCGQWSSMVEEVEVSLREEIREAIFTPLTRLSSLDNKRQKTGVYEFDRVLGGGLSAGSVILLTGEPGVGKSTLLLRALKNLRVMYVSGEESAEQIKQRAKRIGADSAAIQFSSDVQIEGIVKTLEAKIKDFDVLVVDSIQTVYSKEIEASVGSVGQIKMIASKLINFAKTQHRAVIIVGHITKEGDIAGPKTLEHLVDCVLYFEGERLSHFRILRAHKNRFGPTDEVGIFEMKEAGLQEASGSTVFLDNISSSQVGKAIVGITEGQRPLFFEIQSLVVETVLTIPRRVASGIDYNKLLLILAVIRKNLRLPLDRYDIYINVVGGVSIKSTLADCGVAASLISSVKNLPLAAKSLFIGEVGLLGEVRQVIGEEKIIKEAKRFGFSSIYSAANLKSVKDIEYLWSKTK